jgi:hypothetical protein
VTTEKGSKPKLSLVQEEEVYRLDRRPETTSERVRRLQAEARFLAREEVQNLEKALLDCAAMATQVSQGGDAYPVGVRELASRIAEDLPVKVQTIQALLEREPDPKI